MGFGIGRVAKNNTKKYVNFAKKVKDNEKKENLPKETRERRNNNMNNLKKSFNKIINSVDEFLDLYNLNKMTDIHLKNKGWSDFDIKDLRNIKSFKLFYESKRKQFKKNKNFKSAQKEFDLSGIDTIKNLLSKIISTQIYNVDLSENFFYNISNFIYEYNRLYDINNDLQNNENKFFNSIKEKLFPNMFFWKKDLVLNTLIDKLFEIFIVRFKSIKINDKGKIEISISYVDSNMIFLYINSFIEKIFTLYSTFFSIPFNNKSSEMIEEDKNKLNNIFWIIHNIISCYNKNKDIYYVDINNIKMNKFIIRKKIIPSKIFDKYNSSIIKLLIDSTRNNMMHNSDILNNNEQWNVSYSIFFLIGLILKMINEYLEFGFNYCIQKIIYNSLKNNKYETILVNGYKIIKIK